MQILQNPSAVISIAYGDCDELSSIIRHADSMSIQTKPSRGPSRLLIGDLVNGTFCAAYMNTSSIVYSGSKEDLRSIVIPLGKGKPNIFNGYEVPNGQFAAYAPGAEYFCAETSGKRYFHIAIKNSVMRKYFEIALGGPLDLKSSFEKCRPSRPAFRNLIQTVTHVEHLAMNEPDLMDDPIVNQNIEHSLINAWVNAYLSTIPEPRIMKLEKTRVRIQEDLIHLQDYIHLHNDEPIYLLDLCAAVGVSMRQLNYIFQSHYGVSPMLYLKKHRLSVVRKILKASSKETSSIKQIALSNGFSELGRFANEYRQTYGEAPSQTMASGPEQNYLFMA